MYHTWSSGLLFSLTAKKNGELGSVISSGRWLLNSLYVSTGHWLVPGSVLVCATGRKTWRGFELHLAFKSRLSLPVVGSFFKNTSPHFSLWFSLLRMRKSWRRSCETCLCRTAALSQFSNLLLLFFKSSVTFSADKGRLPIPWVTLSTVLWSSCLQ